MCRLWVPSDVFCMAPTRCRDFVFNHQLSLIMSEHIQDLTNILIKECTVYKGMYQNSSEYCFSFPQL